MAESACLARPFSYDNGVKQGNPMLALGDSVSFGRFTSESLSWEKWSTFSHKSYVEEAERHAQPGSVAQKKAFFEAHYKSIAAKKAAALLEQANAANNHPKPELEQSTDNLINHSHIVHRNYDIPNAELHKAENGKVEPELLSSNSAVNQKAPGVRASPAKPAAPIHPGRGNAATKLIQNTAAHSMDKLNLTPKSPHREQDESTTPAAQRIHSSSAASSPNKKSRNCKTALSTPMKASSNGILVNPSAIPSSESKRSRTELDISTTRSKTSASKWHILSAVCSKSFSACRNKLQSPDLSSPSSLRTEERAARRKQKLEEKFNASEGQKVQVQTRLKEKAGTELRKLRQSLCFRAQPLPDFYKERETAEDQIKKNIKLPLPRPNSPKLGRGKRSSSPLQGIISPPQETASSKKSQSKNFLKKEKSGHKSVLLAP